MNKSSNSDQMISEVKQWLLEKNTHLEDIPEDLNLIENRLIDSLQFVSFLMFLEELREEEIEVDNVDFSMFQTLRAIKANFFNNNQ
ncbi:MAG: acyl carrier protein [Waterburya sp.]